MIYNIIWPFNKKIQSSLCAAILYLRSRNPTNCSYFLETFLAYCAQILKFSLWCMKKNNKINFYYDLKCHKLNQFRTERDKYSEILDFKHGLAEMGKRNFISEVFIARFQLYARLSLERKWICNIYNADVVRLSNQC